MSKKTVKLYSHNKMQVLIDEVYEDDFENGKKDYLEYHFLSYEEAKADMDFQNRVNGIVGTGAIDKDLKRMSSICNDHYGHLKVHDTEIMKHKDSLHKHIAKYSVFRRVSLITNSIILIILLIIAVSK